jgi:flagellar biosynthesis/type III secretory pathway M-ring protein FliF/YscJ
MGLKSGSRDAGLDESEDDIERTERRERVEARTETEESPSVTTETSIQRGDEGETKSASKGNRPAMDSIPYKLRRKKVNEGREQVPYFLRKEITEAEDELQDTLEATLGEDVYKSDYREAAMVVAQRNPELVAEVLREWGYDLAD